jgi:hypothetical protein
MLPAQAGYSQWRSARELVRQADHLQLAIELSAAEMPFSENT